MKTRSLLGRTAAAAALFAAVSTAGVADAAQTAGTTPYGLSQAERGGALARLPDWTGLWMPIGTLVFDTATADPPGATAQVPGDRIHPPYNAEWEAKYQAILERNIAGYFSDPITNCLPHGMPRLLGGIPGPLEFAVLPEQIWVLYEWGPQLRRIYTDGRGHMSPDEIFPTWNGDSIGHWEGDTLVVETIAMRDDTPYDRTGAPHSDQVKVTERIRLVDANTLEDSFVIEDPVAFTEPWHVTRRYRKRPPTERVLDVVCTETQHSPIVDGVTQLQLPSDPPGFVMGPMRTERPAGGE